MNIMDHLKVGFVGFFRRSGSGGTPYDHSYVPYRQSKTLVFLLWSLLLGWIDSLLLNEPLELPLSYKSFYLLLQIVAIGCVMPVVTVEAAVLVPWPLTGISF